MGNTGKEEKMESEKERQRERKRGYKKRKENCD